MMAETRRPFFAFSASAPLTFSALQGWRVKPNTLEQSNAQTQHADTEQCHSFAIQVTKTVR